MKEKIMKIILLIVISSILLYITTGYSTFGAPTQFGNESTTTCLIGGDPGIVNCTTAVFSSATIGNLSAGNISTDTITLKSVLSNINTSGITFKPEGGIKFFLYDP